ncbi:hypothetical protein B0T20DRAFT_340980, partial [Sordaria brevicollis]
SPSKPLRLQVRRRREICCPDQSVSVNVVYGKCEIATVGELPDMVCMYVPQVHAMSRRSMPRLGLGKPE